MILMVLKTFYLRNLIYIEISYLTFILNLSHIPKILFLDIIKKGLEPYGTIIFKKQGFYYRFALLFHTKTYKTQTFSVSMIPSTGVFTPNWCSSPNSITYIYCYNRIFCSSTFFKLSPCNSTD